MIEGSSSIQIPVTGSEAYDIRPGEESRTPALVARQIAETIFEKLGEGGVTTLSANRQEEKLGDLEDGYYVGYRTGYREGSTDLLTGALGRRVTAHDLYQFAGEVIRAGHNPESDISRQLTLIVMTLDFNGLKDGNDIFGHI